MAKRVLLNILKRQFADFVVGLNEESLRVGVWSGKVELKDLEVNEAAVNQLDLPVTVLHGSIKKFALHIPWATLDRNPVRVEIEGVYLLLGRVESGGGGEGPKARARRLAIKRSKLEKAEQQYASREEQGGIRSGDDPAPLGPVGKLVQRVADNIEIAIKNVHIRYEDESLAPLGAGCVSVGITLHEFLVATTDENFEVAFLDRVRTGIQSVHKIVSLKGLGLYWKDADAERVQGLSGREIQHRLLREIREVDSGDRMGYLLHPRPILLKMRHNTNPSDTIGPRYEAYLEMEELGLELRTEQLEQALVLKDNQTALSNWAAYAPYRPRVSPFEAPRAWWLFAYVCVTKRPNGWARTMRIIMARRPYMALVKRLKVDKDSFTVEDQLTLDDFEDDLPLEAIMLFRRKVHAEIRLEAKEVAPSTGGWFGGWFGSRNLASKSVASEGEDDSDVSDLVSDNLRAEAETDQKFQRELPGDYTVTKITVSPKGSLTLRQRGGAVLIRTDISASCDLELQQDGTISSAAQVMQFRICDLFTPNPLFPYLVQQIGSAKVECADSVQPLISARLRHKGRDTELSLTAQPLLLAYNRELIALLVASFSVSSRIEMQGAQDAVFKQLQEAQERAREFFKESSILKVSIEAAAPLIVVPSKKVDREDNWVLHLDCGYAKIDGGVKGGEGSWNISLSDVGAQVIQAGEEGFMAKMRRPSQAMIEPFGILLEIATCPPSAGPAVDIKARLFPHIRGVISPIKVMALYAILDYTTGTDDHEELSLGLKGLGSNARTGVLDLTEPSSALSGDDPFLHLLVGAPDKASVINPLSVSLKLSAMVGGVELALVKEGASHKELFVLSAGELTAKLQTRSADMSLSLSLSSLSLVDLVGADPRHMIQSIAEHPESDGKLIHVHVSRVLDVKTSPLWDGSRHEVEVGVRFAVLSLSLNSSCLDAVAPFYRAVIRSSAGGRRSERPLNYRRQGTFSDTSSLAQYAPFTVKVAQAVAGSSTTPSQPSIGIDLTVSQVTAELLMAHPSPQTVMRATISGLHNMTSVKGTDIEASVTLQAINIEDARDAAKDQVISMLFSMYTPENKGVPPTQLSEAAEEAALLQVSFSKKGADQNLAVTVRQFACNFMADPIKQGLLLFTEVQEAMLRMLGPPTEAQPVAARPLRRGSSLMRGSSLHASRTSRLIANQDLHHEGYKLAACIHIEGARVNLVEDPASHDSRKAVLQMGACLDFVRTVDAGDNSPCDESFSVSLKGLECFVDHQGIGVNTNASTNESEQPDPGRFVSQVLEPLNAELSVFLMSNRGQLVSSTIAAQVSDLEARVSYMDILLVKTFADDVLAGWAGAAAVDDRDIEEELTLSAIEGGPAAQLFSCGSVIAEEEEQDGSTEMKETEHSQCTLVRTIRVACSCQGARIVLINDYEGQGIPVLRGVSSAMTVKGEGVIGDFECIAEFQVECSYFNSKVVRWEPVLESVTPKLHFSQLSQGSQAKLRLQTDETIMINITDDMLETLLLSAWMIFSQDPLMLGDGVGGAGPLSEPIMRRGSTVNGITFHNNTGLDIVIHSDDCIRRRVVVAAEETLVLAFPQSRHRSATGDFDMKGKTISIYWKGMLADSREPLEGLRIDESGMRVYSLVPFEPLPSGCVVSGPIVEETWQNYRFDNLSRQWVPFGGGNSPEWTSGEWNGDSTRGSGSLDWSPGSIHLPSDQWEWLDDWHVDITTREINIEIDEEGWEYAVEPRQFTLRTKGRTKKDFDQVRRRRWIRTRAPKPLPLNDIHRPLSVLWHVAPNPQGRLELHLQSTVNILNSTRWELEVSCLCSAWGENSAHLGTVAPKGVLHVPVRLTYASHYQLMPRIPSSDGHGERYTWCKRFPILAAGVDAYSNVWATCSLVDGSEAAHPLHFIVHMEYCSGKLLSLEILPPLLVENCLPVSLSYRAQHLLHRENVAQATNQTRPPSQIRITALRDRALSSKSSIMDPEDVEFGQVGPAERAGVYRIYMEGLPLLAVSLPQYDWSDSQAAMPATKSEIRIFHSSVEFALHDGAGGFLKLMGAFTPQKPLDRSCPAMNLTVSCGLWLVDRTGMGLDFAVDKLRVPHPPVSQGASGGEQHSGSEGADKLPFPDVLDMETLSTRKAYEIGKVEVGSALYVDREYVFDERNVPQNLLGCSMIRTANDDKMCATAPGHRQHAWLQFRISAPATVYLLYDLRGTPPLWVHTAGFQRTRQDIFVSHEIITRTVSCPFAVYSAVFDAGSVVRLGGNQGEGTSTMYVVVVGKRFCVSQVGHQKEFAVGAVGELESAWVGGQEGLFLSHFGSGAIGVGFPSVEGHPMKWSTPLQLSGTASTGGAFSVEHMGTVCELSLKVEQCPGKFHRSTRVTVIQRFCIVNLLADELQLRQSRRLFNMEAPDAHPDLIVRAGDWQAWHWPSPDGDRTLRFRTSSSSWSLGSVGLEAIGTTALHLPAGAKSSDGVQSAIHVDIKLSSESSAQDYAITVVVWGASTRDLQVKHSLPSDLSPLFPLYRVVNTSDDTVLFSQSVASKERRDIVVENATWSLPPERATPFAWAYFDEPRILKIGVETARKMAELNTEGVGNWVKIPGEGRLRAMVVMKGETKTIVISKGTPREVLEAAQHSEKCLKSSFMVELDVPRVGLSIVGRPHMRDSMMDYLAISRPPRQELLYAQMTGLKLSFTAGLVSSLDAEIGSVQVDNYIPGKAYSVMFCRDTVRPASGSRLPLESADKEPLVRFSVIAELDEVTGTRHYEYIACRILDLLVQADTVTAVELLAFAIPVRQYLSLSGKQMNSELWLASMTAEALRRAEGKGGVCNVHRIRSEVAAHSRMYFKYLAFHPVLVSLSWAATRVDPYLVDLTASRAIETIPSVSSSRLSLRSYIVDDVFGVPEEIRHLMISYYLQQLTGQVLNLVGSLRALGSPADLLSNVGGGAKSLLYAPIEGDILHPGEFLSRIGTSATSLARTTVGSLFQSMAGMGAGVTNMAARLSMDDEYERQRDARQTRGMVRQGGLAQSLAAGGQSIVGGVVDGVSGIFTKPMDSGRKEGVAGFFKGAGKGMVGALVKPVVGVSDGIVSVFQGVSNEVSSSTRAVPLRQQRALQYDGETTLTFLTPFSSEAMYAQAMLLRVSKNDAYSGHMLLGNLVLVLGRDKLLLQPLDPRGSSRTAALAALASGQPKDAPFSAFPWEEIACVELTSQGVKLVMYTRDDIEVTTSSKAEHRELYSQLASHAQDMGDPSRVIPPRLALAAVESYEFTPTSAPDEEKEGKGASSDDVIEDASMMINLDSRPAHRSVMRAHSTAVQSSVASYTFGRANQAPSDRHTAFSNTSDADFLAAAESRLLRMGVGSWDSLDMLLWDMVSKWEAGHSLWKPSRCLAAAFINASASSVQFSSVTRKEGGGYRILSGPEWDEPARQLGPGGFIVLFAWGKAGLPGFGGNNVELQVESSALSLLLTLKHTYQALQSKGRFKCGFAEKTLTKGFGKFVVTIK